MSKFGDTLAAVLGISGQLLVGDTSPLVEDAPSTPPKTPVTDKQTRTSRNSAPLRAMEPVPNTKARQSLGARAKARRIAVGFSVTSLATQLKIPADSLQSWERALPRRDPPNGEFARWEHALQVPTGWLRDLESPTPDLGQGMAFSLGPHQVTVAALIREASRWLAAPKAARSGALPISLDKERQRHADMLAARYGVLGEDASTLQAIGNQWGVTRERVRQITEKLTLRKQLARFPSQPIEQLSAALAPRLPAMVADLDVEFRELLGESLSVVGANRFAQEMLSMTVLSIDDGMITPVASLGPMAVGTESQDSLTTRLVRSLALRMISLCGAANLYWVTGAASQGLRGPLSWETACRGVALVKGFQWLSEREGWFWFGPDSQNRAINLATKVLAVAPRRVDVEQIGQAMSRSRRASPRERTGALPDAELPLSVLVQLLRSTPGFKAVQHNDFVLEKVPPLDSILSGTEMALYKLMSTRGGISDRNFLLRKLVRQAGMNMISLQVALDQSPIISRIDYGLYALRGWQLEKGAVAKALGAAAKRRAGGGGAPRVKQSTNGPLKFSTMITAPMLRNGVFGLPSQVARVCEEGEYRVNGWEEARPTIARLSDRLVRLRGFVRILREAGFRPGDRADLAIDIDGRTITFLNSPSAQAKSP